MPPSSQSASSTGEASNPWASYESWKGATFPAKDKPASADPRPASGPVEKRFQQQETRLQALEQGLQQFRSEQQQAREEDRTQGLQAVETQVSSLAKGFSEQMRQSTQLRQQEQMQSSLDESKNLIVSPPTRKLPRNGDGGPASSAPASFAVSVANPTAILGKVSEVLSLEYDIALLAETSAVCSTQRTVSKQMRQHAFGCFWSPPVEPHYTADGRAESRRGHEVGAAVFARGPAHSPFASPQALLDSQRFAEARVRVGFLTVQVISVYGFHSGRPHCSRLPTIVGGDFNCDVTSLPVWRSYRDLGYVELHALVRATCKLQASTAAYLRRIHYVGLLASFPDRGCSLSVRTCSQHRGLFRRPRPRHYCVQAA